MRKAAAYLTVAIAAACSRSDLELETVANEANPEAGAETGPTPMGSCPAPTQMRSPSPCTEWRVAGSDTVVSGPADPGDGFYLTSLVPSGDGALISWFNLSGASTASWDTLALNLDGTPRSGIVSHLSFPTMGGVYVDIMSLAVTPQCAFGGLVDDVASGCRFLPLDGDGNEVGPVVSLPGGTDGGCSYLGPAPGGFSYLHEAPANSGVLDLATIGTDGSFHGRAVLGTLPGFGSRITLQDQTFLLASFFENDSGGDLTEEVAHYDANGMQLTPSLTVATNSGSILLMAQASDHVVAAYIGSNPPLGERVFVAALDGGGESIGSGPRTLDVPGRIGPIYGFSLDPLPSGDVMLTWNELDENSTRYHFFAMELDSVGLQFSASTLQLGIYEGVTNPHVIGSADGERALLVYSGAPVGGMGGVHTLPLACAAH